MNFTARLAGVAAALCLSFGAVAADNGTQPITDQDQCHSCDMWITKYPGPKAEIVTKSGHVYKFCSTKCMTCTLLRLGESDKIAGIWAQQIERAAKSATLPYAFYIFEVLMSPLRSVQNGHPPDVLHPICGMVPRS